jgi:hypothetical protein
MRLSDKTPAILIFYFRKIESAQKFHASRVSFALKIPKSLKLGSRERMRGSTEDTFYKYRRGNQKRSDIQEEKLLFYWGMRENGSLPQETKGSDRTYKMTRILRAKPNLPSPGYGATVTTASSAGKDAFLPKFC